MIDPLRPDYTNTPASSGRPYFDYTPSDRLTAPVVSIVTPFYNTGAIFRETAASVFRQSFQQWEWLIINDGSDDVDALAVLDEYRQLGDARLRIIDVSKNRGLSAARSRGFQEAQTDYIVLLDSDDLLEPTAIEKWYWFLQSYPEWSFVHGYSVGFGARQYLWTKGFKDGAASLEENQIDHTSMVRKSVFETAGGFDEQNRAGLEDWDFWLRCANAGYWGSTVPEYLSWYRRRESHNLQWSNLSPEQIPLFRARLRQCYPRLWAGEFPQVSLKWHMPLDSVPDQLPCQNMLIKKKQRLLMLVPWFMWGGADKFNLELTRQLVNNGWEVTIAATLKSEDVWMPDFSRYTPDIFCLGKFLRLVDYPRFLRYLIQSRQIDVVMITSSRLGYLLLPYLRAHFPEVTFIDYNHAVAPEWNNGGYPNWGVQYQELLDLNITASKQVKDWMVQNGASPDRVEVCYINIDTQEWQKDWQQRLEVRRELELDVLTPLILYAARLNKNKQPGVLAKVALRLKQQGLKFAVVAAGDGPEMETLRSFIHENELEMQVFLPGVVSNLRVRQLMSAADVFFLPSKWEGIALSIYEAMACSLPVVSADVGGQRELVTPECGILISRANETEEVERYSNILKELITEPARRIDMGMAGRKRVCQYFRIEQMEQRIQSLIAQAEQLHQTHPCLSFNLKFGHTCALQAVEFTRLQQLADELWAEREKWQTSAEESLAGNKLPGSEKTNIHLDNLANERQTWIEQLEKDKRWLEDLAEKRQAWIEKLEQDKAWLEEQLQNYRARANTNPWIRIKRLLSRLKHRMTR